MSAIVKGKVTNSFKPPLTERPFALGYRELSEMSNWKWWMSERKKQLNKVFVLWWGSEVKQYGNYDKRAESKRRGNQLKKSHTPRGRGTLNVHKCVQGGGWSKIVLTLLNGWPLTVTLKDIPGSSFLNLFITVAIYASTFFPVNIEQCLLLGLSCVLVDSTIPI